MWRPALRLTSCSLRRGASNRALHVPPLSHRMTVTEGRSWVAMVAQDVAEKPRLRSRSLRWAGDARAAHQILKNAGVHHSRDEADLIELLLVLLNTDEFTGPRERLSAMVDTLCASPTGRPKAAYNIVLSACAREAARVSDNSHAKRDVILKTALSMWSELTQITSKPDVRSVALMYRICGDCKHIQLARQICEQVGDPVLRLSQPADQSRSKPSEDAIAAYILCLGKCGRSSEAEQVYFMQHNKRFRSSDKVLSALFQSYLASTKISKAESLIAMYGSAFLNVQSCNAFVKTCAALRLHDSALAFVDRMSRSAETSFPPPNARTYNLLLRGLSAGTGVEDRAVAADKALLVVKQMKQQKIEPTTVTYNTLIRSFVMRNQNDEAFALYADMQSPNRITFSHLMQGAANAGDVRLAQKVLSALIDARERPNYGFCKSYLETVARVEGVDSAFTQAVHLSRQFRHILVFGDVGSQEAVRMALINACGKVGDLQRAFEALSLKLGTRDRESGVLAPLYVATVVMQVCMQCNAHGQALELFHSLKQAGLEPNFEVYESLIYGLSSYVRSEGNRQGNQQDRVAREEYDEETQYLYEQLGADEEQFSGRVQSNVLVSKGMGTRSRGAELTLEQAIKMAVGLLREMHERKAGRSLRQAAYVYNTLIAAAAAMGDFELALQIFNKMSRRNNPGVIYVSKQGETGGDASSEMLQDAQRRDEKDNVGLRDRQYLAALAETGMFDSEYEFPAATVGTYNSMIDAAWKCGQPWFSFQVFDMMEMDRITEANAATLSLLTDIALSEVDTVDVEKQRRLLKELDRFAFLSEEVSRKRIRLRQKLLALRWS